MTSLSTSHDLSALLRASRHLESLQQDAPSSSSSSLSSLTGSKRDRDSSGLSAGADEQRQAVGRMEKGVAINSYGMKPPRLQRTLHQLDVASRNLVRSTAPSSSPPFHHPAADTLSSAQLLLTRKGIDIRKQNRTLRDIELSLPAQQKRLAAGTVPYRMVDLDRYLRGEELNSLNAAMEEAARQTSDSFRHYDLASLNDDWELAKHDILHSLGFRVGKEAIEVGGGGGQFDSRANQMQAQQQQQQQSPLTQAAALEAHGLVLEAVQLYIELNRFDLSVELLLKTLSPLVSRPLQDHDRQVTVEAAQQVQRIIQERGGIESVGSNTVRNNDVGLVSEFSFHALHQLLLLVNYFDFYHLGPTQYEAALTILSSNDINFIPFHTQDVSSYTIKFDIPNGIHIQLKKLISDLAISLMDIYYIQFQYLQKEIRMQSSALFYHGGMSSGAIHRDESKQFRLHSLRDSAHALVSFIGLLQSALFIDIEVHRKLVETEAIIAA